MSNTPATIGTRTPVRVGLAAVCGIGLAAAALAATPAEAQYPGDNGDLAYYVIDRGAPQANPPVPATSVIYTAKADGSDQTPLTPADDYVREPSWSRDGTKLAYIKRPQQGSGRELYVRDIATGAETLIPDGTGAADPVWNYDGTRIAFSKSVRGNTSIYWVYADGSPGGEKLSQDGQDARDPAYSPDGQQLVYSVVTSSGQGAPCPVNLESDLWRMDADGGNPEQLTDGECASANPSWSPDGSRIAFDSTRANGSHLYILNVANGQVDPLTTANPTHWQYAPHWSADGRYISYADDDPQLPGGNDIRLIDADGTNDRSTGITAYDAVWQSIPTTDPNNPGIGTTELSVKAMKASKKLAVGEKKKLVKSAETNGQITKVKIVCKTDGEKVKGKEAKKKVCGAKEKKKDDPTTAKVVAKPKCDSKVRIKAVVKAQYQTADAMKWKRTWKVKKNTGPNC